MAGVMGGQLLGDILTVFCPQLPPLPAFSPPSTPPPAPPTPHPPLAFAPHPYLAPLALVLSPGGCCFLSSAPPPPPCRCRALNPKLKPENLPLPPPPGRCWALNPPPPPSPPGRCRALGAGLSWVLSRTPPAHHADILLGRLPARVQLVAWEEDDPHRPPGVLVSVLLLM